MAHTKAKGSTKLGRDSASQRLGLKVGSGESVIGGQILVRQRGTKYLPGTNVRVGSDDTLYSVTVGKVKFINQKIKNPYQRKKFRTIVVIEKV